MIEGKVMFGAWVEIENREKGLKKRLHIVRYVELIGNKDYISMDPIPGERHYITCYTR